jgi:hypothetical protein
MTYDWEEIFENKSDKELYEIYCGNSLLPELTIPLAKNELKKRKFDFENIELHKEAWKLSRVEEEIDYLKFEILRRTPISLKAYLFIVIALAIFAVIISKTLNLETKASFVSFAGGIVSITIILIGERLVYKKKVENLNKFLGKRSKIVEKLSEKVNLNEKQHILENLNKESNDRIKQLLSTNKILMIIAAIILLLYLAFRYVF